MRKVLSAILAMSLILGCMAVGFTAQASGADLTRGIAAAIANGDDSYEWTGADVTLDKTIVIDVPAGKDFTVDFGGATIYGAQGQDAVLVKSGNVTLYDGVIYPMFKITNDWWEGILNLMGSRTNAVRVTGGNLTVKDCFLMGGMWRVPGTAEDLPFGEAIKYRGGKDLTIKNSLVAGLEGVIGHVTGNFLIDDSIIFGLNEAVYYDGYTIPEGSKEYKTVDVLQEALKEGVNMTEREIKYAKYLTERVGNLCMVISDPVFEAPVFTYDKDADTLTVTVKADDKDVDTEVSPRYSYRYIPTYITVTAGDGQPVKAAAVEDASNLGTFTATFTGIGPNTLCKADIDWKLAVLMTEYQAEDVKGVFDKMAQIFNEDVPEYLDQAINLFEDRYDEIKEDFQLLWNVYNDVNAEYPEVFAEYTEDVHKLYGQLINVYGAKLLPSYTNLNARRGTYQGDINWNNWIDSLRNTTDYTRYWGATLIDDDGNGLLDHFDKYYGELKAKLYPNNQLTKESFMAAAKYVGDNYSDVYDIIKTVPTILDSLNEVLGSPEGAVAEIVNRSGELGEYIGYIKRASDGLKDVIATVDNARLHNSYVTTIENEYAGKIGDTMAIYAGKAWTMLSDPDVYFDPDIVDTQFRFFDWQTNAEYTTPDETVYYNVHVSVSGYGNVQAFFEGISESDAEFFSSEKSFRVPAGQMFGLEADAGEGADLTGFFYDNKDNGTTNWSEGLSYFTVGSDIYIIVTFTSKTNAQNPLYHTVRVLTDEHLGFAQIASQDFEYGDFNINGAYDDLQAPKFAGAEFIGWSLDMSGEGAVEDIDDLADAVDEIEGDVIIFACYQAEDEILIPVQTEAARFDSVAYDAESGRVYFNINFVVPEGYVGIQAGAIVTKDASLATEDKLNLDNVGTAGIAVTRVDKYADNYLLPTIAYSLGVRSAAGTTIYGRGYIVLQNVETNEITTVYTDDIASGTIGG